MAARSGYAVASSDMNVLAHGLHGAKYSKLPADSIPKSKPALTVFLRELIVKSQSATPGDMEQCTSLIVDGFGGYNNRDHDLRINHLADNLWKIQEFSEELYNQAVCGDITLTRNIAKKIPDLNFRNISLGAIARCAQFWGAFDLQRSACCRRASRVSIYPYFMRPFTKTLSTNENINILQLAENTIHRIFSADDIARRHGR
ncbi:hypothetical protein [Sphingomonas sp. PAMC 26621]|uniref:hypothetical protein n=1 Tax=Sphingomonas sp. PAMC 26621 TaxID=1112213 RepID=UPI0011115797|nr:hypothetical protein [Sphingomonas sp. PAMC 26621]